MEDKLDTIIDLLKQLIELQTKPSSTSQSSYNKWTPEQEALLITLHNKDTPQFLIIEELAREFGIVRSAGAIESRLRKLGVERG